MHKAFAEWLASLPRLGPWWTIVRAAAPARPRGAAATLLQMLAACAIVLLLATRAGAAEPATSESALKAAFLYKVASFVQWPAGTFKGDEPLVIAVMDDPAVAGELEQMVAGRNYEGRAIAVRRLGDRDDTTGVHVLLVGAVRDPRLREIAAATPGPVLVVSEQESGLRLGAVLNFLA